MFKPPKIDSEKYQTYVDPREYRGQEDRYRIEERQVYANQKVDTTHEIIAKRVKRSNSMTCFPLPTEHEKGRHASKL